MTDEMEFQEDFGYYLITSEIYFPSSTATSLAQSSLEEIQEGTEFQTD